MTLLFEVGQRVLLTPSAIVYYGGTKGFAPEGQGGGKPGTITFAGERPHKFGAAPRPYYVRWDNGVCNSYREDDLMLFAENSDQTSSIPTNVIAFKR